VYMGCVHCGSTFQMPKHYGTSMQYTKYSIHSFTSNKLWQIKSLQLVQMWGGTQYTAHSSCTYKAEGWNTVTLVVQSVQMRGETKYNIYLLCNLSNLLLVCNLHIINSSNATSVNKDFTVGVFMKLSGICEG